MIQTVHPDADLIRQLGGPAAIAKRLNYTKKGSIQRVHNWTKRGIPPVVRLSRPDIFGKPEARHDA